MRSFFKQQHDIISDITYIESIAFVNQFYINQQKTESIKNHSRFSLISIIQSKSDKLNEYIQERQYMINIFNILLTKQLRSNENLSLDSFKILYRLGNGGYGSVFLVQFITSFKDNEYVYLTFEWLQGRDLYTLMNYQKLTELQAQFYSEQIVMALDYLHECKIVFRDLKPENIVLTQRGYIKLIDLGLAKIIRAYSQTFCGTPHYIGIIIHEMVTGDAPYDRTYRIHSNISEIESNEINYHYRTKSTIENYTSDIIRSSSKHYNMYLRIINGCSSMNLKNVTKNCALLIRNLLEYNIEKRLDCGVRGALDIIEHPWFDKINFWILYQQKYIAPFIPIRKCIIKNKYLNETLLTFTAKNQYDNQFIEF